jgi:hypothetical protein
MEMEIVWVAPLEAAAAEAADSFSNVGKASLALPGRSEVVESRGESVAEKRTLESTRSRVPEAEEEFALGGHGGGGLQLSGAGFGNGAKEASAGIMVDGLDQNIRPR